MSEVMTPPAPAKGGVSPKSGKGRRSDYDQLLANDIAATGALVEAALGDEAVLEAISYSKEELEEGLALKEAAQEAFDTRQTAQGAAGAKRVLRDALLGNLIDEFKAFRITVQNSFPSSARTPLGAGGSIPADLQKRITLMRGAYTTAQTPAFAPTLAKRKLTVTLLKARVKQVDEIEKFDRDFKAADKGATAATKARDAAGDAMRAWAAKFRKQVKSDLRRQPGLLAKLGL